jgi:hypothetical protein
MMWKGRGPHRKDFVVTEGLVSGLLLRLPRAQRRSKKPQKKHRNADQGSIHLIYVRVEKKVCRQRRGSPFCVKRGSISLARWRATGALAGRFPPPSFAPHPRSILTYSQLLALYVQCSSRLPRIALVG